MYPWNYHYEESRLVYWILVIRWTKTWLLLWSFLVRNVLTCYTVNFCINNVYVSFTNSNNLCNGRFYGLAHVKGISQLMLPWSINTVLIALPYYAIGYYSRNIVHILKKKLVLSLGIVVFSVIVILEQMQKLNYELDLKAGVYNHLYLDIIIPISCIVLLFHLSNNLKYRWLEKMTESIGMASMSIMFLHIPIYILGLKYTDNGFLLGIIGILISYSIHQLFKLSFITRFMFLVWLQREVLQSYKGQIIP